MAANGSSAPTFDVPKECKAGVVVDEGPNFRVEVQMVPVPEIKPNEVLIKINATGICHSDLHFMSNDWGLGPMSQQGTRCAGHEGAGVIVKVGDQVTHLKVGQRAGFKPVADTCGMCELCRSDKECYCAKAILTGFHCDGMARLRLIKVEADMRHRQLQAVCQQPGAVYHPHPRRRLRLRRRPDHVLRIYDLYLSQDSESETRTMGRLSWRWGRCRHSRRAAGGCHGIASNRG